MLQLGGNSRAKSFAARRERGKVLAVSFDSQEGMVEEIESSDKPIKKVTESLTDLMLRRSFSSSDRA